MSLMAEYPLQWRAGSPAKAAEVTLLAGGKLG